MKHLLTLLLLTINSFAAISSATTWEVRPTVGASTNGGGFVTGASGTDYSVQNSANSGGNNGSTTDAVAAGTTTITSVTASFTSAIVGNIIYLAGGSGSLTATRRQVVTFTNSTTIVVDATVATGTGITMNIGGALDLAQTANSFATANNVVYGKSTGSNTFTSAMTIALDSSAAPATPYSFIGYTTTRGDNGQVTWTTSTNSITLIEFTQAKNVIFQNINFTTSAGTPGKGINAKTTGNSFQIFLINCKLTGFTIGITGDFNVDWSIDGLFVINTRITGCSSHGIINTGTTYLLGTILDNNGGDGLRWSTGSPWTSHTVVILKSILYKNTGNGLNVIGTNSGGTTFPTFTIDHSNISTNTVSGVLMGNVNNPGAQITNSIFDANGAYGIDTSGSSGSLPILGYNNAFYNNTTAATRGVFAGIGTITLSGSPYTNLATLNFALNNTSGAGAALKATAFPGVMQSGGTGYADVGALQSQATAGGGQFGFPIVQ